MYFWVCLWRYNILIDNAQITQLFLIMAIWMPLCAQLHVPYNLLVGLPCSDNHHWPVSSDSAITTIRDSTSYPLGDKWSRIMALMWSKTDLKYTPKHHKHNISEIIIMFVIFNYCRISFRPKLPSAWMLFVRKLFHFSPKRWVSLYENFVTFSCNF